MDTIMHEAFKPLPYVPANKREWIICDGEYPEDIDDLEDAKGIAILVRTSVSMAEQKDLQGRHAMIVENLKNWLESDKETRGEFVAPKLQEWEMISPYVLEWNVMGITIEGERVPAPPPAVSGPQAFELLNDAESAWVTKVVLGGYVNTGKVRRSPKLSGTTGSTITLVEEIPDSTDTPQKSSSGRRQSRSRT